VLSRMKAAHPSGAAAAEARACRRVAAAAAAMREVQAALEREVEAAQAAGAPPLFASPADAHVALLKRQEAAVREALAEDAAAEADAASRAPPCATPPPKFILYSPLSTHLHLFAEHLALAGWNFALLTAGAAQAGGPAARTAAVTAFKHAPGMSCLLMDDCGAVGHDLSCASHVFLLEPLRDAALENQVISRAWRMGCPHAVVRVETLAMRGTAEQGVIQLRACPVAAAAEAQNRTLLLNLRHVAGLRTAADEEAAAPTSGACDAQRFVADAFSFPALHCKLARLTEKKLRLRARGADTALRIATPAKAVGGSGRRGY